MGFKKILDRSEYEKKLHYAAGHTNLTDEPELLKKRCECQSQIKRRG